MTFYQMGKLGNTKRNAALDSTKERVTRNVNGVPLRIKNFHTRRDARESILSC